MKYDPGEGIYFDICSVSLADVGELGLFVVGLDPDVALHEVDDLHAGRDQLTFLNMALADRAVGGRRDASVSKIDLSDDSSGLLGLDVSLIERIPRAQRIELTLLRFEQCAAAGKRGLGALQIGLAAGEHSGEPSRIRLCRFVCLACRRLGSQQRLLAARLAAHPDDPAGWARLVRSYGVLGQTTQRDAALGRARVLFKDRPADLAVVESAETTRP